MDLQKWMTRFQLTGNRLIDLLSLGWISYQMTESAGTTQGVDVALP